MLDGSENFYAFEIVDKVKLVDSKYKILNIKNRYLGNKSRFINHSKLKNNCEVKIIYSKGYLHIGFYALDNLVPGVELFIDYDGKYIYLILKALISLLRNTLGY
jgi:SET domain-containing protein